MIYFVLSDKPQIVLSETTQSLGTFVNNNIPVVLKCKADGVPDPKYRWIDPLGKHISSVQEYELRNPSLAQFGDYICEASNKLGSVRKAINVFQISKYIYHW